MKHRSWPVALVVLVASGTGRAADPDPETVLKRHVAAIGGHNRVTKAAVATIKLAGTIQGRDGPIPFAVETITGVPGRSRTSVKLGDAAPVVTVAGRDGVFVTAAGRVREATQDEAANEKLGQAAAAVMKVTPVLADPKYKLASLGTATRDGRVENGVKVSCAGTPDVTLWFDEQTHLLARVSRVGILDRVQEDHLSEYKEFSGIKYPTRRRTYIGGNLAVDLTAQEVTFSAAVDEQVFAKPGAPAPPGATDPETLLKRHVAAAGGAERLATVACTTVELVGTIHRENRRTAIETRFSFALPDRGRISQTVAGEERVVTVVGRDGGFARVGERPTRAMTADEVEQQRLGLWCAAVTQVAPILGDPKFRLAALGTGTKNGVAANGVRVSYPGRPDMDLWFDAETHLLTCIASGGGGRVQEERLGEYKEYAGVKYATRRRTYIDGALAVDLAARYVGFAAAADESMFVKP